MKTIKMGKFSFARPSPFVCLILFLFSCTTDGNVEMEEVNGLPVNDEIRAKFNDLGFDGSNLEVIRNTNPYEVMEDEFVYLVEGDIRVTANQLSDWIGAESTTTPNGEQYRTNALVQGPATIKVVADNSGSDALTNKMIEALRNAVQNYKDENLNLTFKFSQGANPKPKPNKIIVYNNGSGGGGASAGFPTGGLAYGYVSVNQGMQDYAQRVIKHVMTHEIGHCIGFRHTDYFNRSISCGTGGNEGSGGVGHVHIPGTPTGADMSSIMLSCFNTNVSGEFSSADKTALNYLY